MIYDVNCDKYQGAKVAITLEMPRWW